jgi:hypothetical protein
MNIKLLGSVGAISLVAVGAVVGNGSANAAIMGGDSFGMAGNLYFTSAQFDFVGPPPTTSPLTKTPNADGYFTIFRGDGDFTNGIFNPPQTVGPRASFIKDIADPVQCGGGGCVITQSGPVIDDDFPGDTDDPPFGPVVNDFIKFDNTGSGGSLNFSIDLETLTRISPLGLATPLTQVTFELTGKLTDLTTGKVFNAVGSVTPNIGSGVKAVGFGRNTFVKDLTIGQLNPFTFQGQNGIGYQMDWTVSEIQVPEPMTGIGAVAAFGLGSLLTRKRKDQGTKS